MHTPLTPKDVLTALTPAVATITIAQLNSLLGVVSGALGIVYLIWKWRRDYKSGPRV